ncbi:peptidoglycan DD-metalloendopeptidase family protein [Devosia albogilva]|uniref:Peptidoglycan DD-metalloendopeptidase family protein n=1 Tax=Devosia albogilva TaxID=429726 RepID=A0ABW5QQ08_9HYPH
MSMRLSRPAAKNAVAVATLIVGAVALSGCSSLGSRTFGDPVTTGTLQQAPPQSVNQPMPASLGAPQTLVAEQQFLPPAPLGGGGNWNSQPAPSTPIWNQPSQQPAWNQPAPMASASAPAVQSQDLPVLSSPSQGSLPAMPAQTALASTAPAPSPAALGTLPTNSSVPTVAASAPTVAPAAANSNGAYYHTIAGGESLYTIARRYDVTTQAIVQANNLGSPDKIVVGQKILIPGRSDLASQPVQVASTTPVAAPAPQPAPAPAPALQQAAATPTPAPATPAATTPQQPAPTQVAAAPAGTQPAAPAPEPAMSGSDKFRWPVSGRVLVDFAASRGTGINIEASEGAPVAAAENGTVIYVGSGVEGYGNLVLIRHPNGYVSAYAHLSSMNVAKGAVVKRGDTIGAAGKTGSVTQSQLHFELRKGATPVDPMPLLS